MPTLDLSQNILGASANYAAEDWATFGASATLDARVAAVLRRGIDLELGAQALVRLDASVHKFLAVDLQGQAHAAARVKAQVQVPLDLFDECGAAIRLQAVAEAAAGITLGIGLSVGDFIALAEQDPRMTDVSVRLLRILLEEVTVKGGVMAKVAAAAMAYANVSITGRLVPGGAAPTGFTVAAEAGIGLEAGAGFRVFANLGVNDPRRLLRRSVDAIVDETIAAVGTRVPSQRERAVLGQLRAPTKMALRCAFELGLELAASRNAYDPGAGPRLAQRCVQVFLEEAQRALVEQFAVMGLQRLREALSAIGFDQTAWDQARVQREALAQRLGLLPAESFEATPQNEAYWIGLVGDAANLAVALGAQSRAAEPWVEPVAMAWAAAQLLFVSVRRISETQARASVIGLPPAQAARAFQGPISTQPPPAVVRELINTRLGRPAGAAIDQEVLIAFLLRREAVEQLLGRYPHVQAVLDLVAGPNSAGAVAAMSTILTNIGAFAPGSNGASDPQASLRVIILGLQSFMDTRLRDEVEPLLRDALATSDPELRLYVDEVLLGTLRFAVNTIFSQLLQWSSGSLDGQTALREACSSILMQLFGRSLVVTTDVLLNKALADVNDGFRDASDHVNDAGGVAPVLADLTGLNRDLLAEIMQETLQIAAETFGPLPESQRARIRDLLYQVIDTMPASAGAPFVDQLKADAFVPNAEAARDLSLELGGYIGDTIVRFIGAFLDRVGTLALEALLDGLEDLAEAVQEWLSQLEDLARDAAMQLQALVREIGRKAAELETALDEALERAEVLLNAFSRNANRNALRSGVRTLLCEQAMGALATIPFYANLPKEARRVVRDALDAAIRAVLNTGLFDPVIDALGGIAGEAAEFLQDVRAIDPGDDLAEEIIDLFADRIEDAIRAAFGYQNPGVNIRFNALGFDFALGRVGVPLNELVAVVRRLARDLAAIEDLAQDVAGRLVRAIEAELGLQAAEAERELMQALKDRSDALLAESHRVGFDAVIVQPAPAAVQDRDVDIRILLPGVPRSWLGLDEDEAARVFVWINHDDVDQSRFTVSEITEPGRDRAAIVGGLPLKGMLEPSARREDADRIDPVNRPGGPFGAHPLAVAWADRHDRAAAGRPAIPAIAPADKAAKARAEGAQGLLQRKGSVTVGRDGQWRGDATATAPTLGRHPLPTHVGAIVASSPPGLVLRARLPLDQFKEGANTLSVAVLGLHKKMRVLRTVTFLVLEAPGRPVDRPASRPVPAAGKLGWDRDAVPALMRRAIATRFGEEMIRNDSSASPGPRRSEGDFRMPLEADRKKGVAQAKKTQLDRLVRRGEELSALRTALRQGALRPAVSIPPKKEKSGAAVKRKPVADRPGRAPDASPRSKS